MFLSVFLNLHYTYNIFHTQYIKYYAICSDYLIPTKFSQTTLEHNHTYKTDVHIYFFISNSK